MSETFDYGFQVPKSSQYGHQIDIWRRFNEYCGKLVSDVCPRAAVIQFEVFGDAKIDVSGTIAELGFSLWKLLREGVVQDALKSKDITRCFKPWSRPFIRGDIVRQNLVPIHMTPSGRFMCNVGNRLLGLPIKPRDDSTFLVSDEKPLKVGMGEWNRAIATRDFSNFYVRFDGVNFDKLLVNAFPMTTEHWITGTRYLTDEIMFEGLDIDHATFDFAYIVGVMSCPMLTQGRCQGSRLFDTFEMTCHASGGFYSWLDSYCCRIKLPHDERAVDRLSTIPEEERLFVAAMLGLILCDGLEGFCLSDSPGSVNDVARFLANSNGESEANVKAYRLNGPNPFSSTRIGQKPSFPHIRGTSPKLLAPEGVVPRYLLPDKNLREWFPDVVEPSPKFYQTSVSDEESRLTLEAELRRQYQILPWVEKGPDGFIMTGVTHHSHTHMFMHQCRLMADNVLNGVCNPRTLTFPYTSYFLQANGTVAVERVTLRSIHLYKVLVDLFSIWGSGDFNSLKKVTSTITGVRSLLPHLSISSSCHLWNTADVPMITLSGCPIEGEAPGPFCRVGDTYVSWLSKTQSQGICYAKPHPRINEMVRSGGPCYGEDYHDTIKKLDKYGCKYLKQLLIDGYDCDLQGEWFHPKTLYFLNEVTACFGYVSSDHIHAFLQTYNRDEQVSTDGQDVNDVAATFEDLVEAAYSCNAEEADSDSWLSTLRDVHANLTNSASSGGDNLALHADGASTNSKGVVFLGIEALKSKFDYKLTAKSATLLCFGLIVTAGLFSIGAHVPAVSMVGIAGISAAKMLSQPKPVYDTLRQGGWRVVTGGRLIRAMYMMLSVSQIGAAFVYSSLKSFFKTEGVHKNQFRKSHMDVSPYSGVKTKVGQMAVIGVHAMNVVRTHSSAAIYACFPRNSRLKADELYSLVSGKALHGVVTGGNGDYSSMDQNSLRAISMSIRRLQSINKGSLWRIPQWFKSVVSVVGNPFSAIPSFVTMARSRAQALGLMISSSSMFTTKTGSNPTVVGTYKMTPTLELTWFVVPLVVCAMWMLSGIWITSVGNCLTNYPVLISIGRMVQKLCHQEGILFQFVFSLCGDDLTFFMPAVFMSIYRGCYEYNMYGDAYKSIPAGDVDKYNEVRKKHLSSIPSQFIFPDIFSICADGARFVGMKLGDDERGETNYLKVSMSDGQQRQVCTASERGEYSNRPGTFSSLLGTIIDTSQRCSQDIPSCYRYSSLLFTSFSCRGAGRRYVPLSGAFGGVMPHNAISMYGVVGSPGMKLHLIERWSRWVVGIISSPDGDFSAQEKAALSGDYQRLLSDSIIHVPYIPSSSLSEKDTILSALLGSYDSPRDVTGDLKIVTPNGPQMLKNVNITQQVSYTMNTLYNTTKDRNSLIALGAVAKHPKVSSHSYRLAQSACYAHRTVAKQSSYLQSVVSKAADKGHLLDRMLKDGKWETISRDLARMTHHGLCSLSNVEVGTITLKRISPFDYKATIEFSYQSSSNQSKKYMSTFIPTHPFTTTGGVLHSLAVSVFGAIMGREEDIIKQDPLFNPHLIFASRGTSVNLSVLLELLNDEVIQSSGVYDLLGVTPSDVSSIVQDTPDEARDFLSILDHCSYKVTGPLLDLRWQFAATYLVRNSDSVSYSHRDEFKRIVSEYCIASNITAWSILLTDYFMTQWVNCSPAINTVTNDIITLPVYATHVTSNAIRLKTQGPLLLGRLSSDADVGFQESTIGASDLEAEFDF